MFRKRQPCDDRSYLGLHARKTTNAMQKNQGMQNSEISMPIQPEPVSGVYSLRSGFVWAHLSKEIQGPIHIQLHASNTSSQFKIVDKT